MKTKIALKRITMLTLAFLISTAMWADDKEKTAKKENLPVAHKHYTPIEQPTHVLDAAEEFSYLSVDPGIDEITNYPEPFASSTTIQYNLNRSGYVNLTIFWANTRLEIFARDYQKEGSHMVEFNSIGLPPGVYTCVLVFENQVVYETMVKKAPLSQKKYLED